MMIITILKPPQGGTIAAIASKSHAHRALIAAVFADKQTGIVCGETNEDIQATVRCLQALGAQIDYSRGVFYVIPLSLPINNESRMLDCGESGATLRFMLPVACALGTNASFQMEGRLAERPLSPLYDALVSHGCNLSPQGSSPQTVSGQLSGGVFRIAGNISSQFITGLLLALPLLKEESRIDVVGNLESRPYVDITINVLADFGLDIQKRGGSFFIRGNQIFISPQTLTIEGDWSNAACWFALGAIHKTPVTVTGLKLNSPQGDKAFLEILERFGAQVVKTAKSITVSGGDIHGIDVDVSANPDLVPMIAAVALAADGQTRILNAARLRLKESDRLHTIAQTLGAFGAQISEMADGLIIHGGSKLHGGVISSQGDHRIVMMAAVASAVCENELVIKHAEAVNKSYPRFFNDFRSLGGKTREEQP